jgi:hypothetical protein
MQKQVVGTERDLLYDSRGQTMKIPLCYSHSVELFKNGQTNFIAKYEENFKGHYGLEEDMDYIDHINDSKKRMTGWYKRAS